MKRIGLTPLLLSATLFLTADFIEALRAQENMTPPAPKSAPAMSTPKRMTNQEVLKRYDKNGDGKIDDDERAEARELMLKDQVDRQMARAAALGGTEAFRTFALELFDKNRDGQLDEEERVAARNFAEQNGLGAMGQLSEELVRRFDKNANGRIDDDERPALFEYLKQRRGVTSAPAPVESELRPGREAEKKKLDTIAAEVAKRRTEREKNKEVPAK